MMRKNVILFLLSFFISSLAFALWPAVVAFGLRTLPSVSSSSLVNAAAGLTLGGSAYSAFSNITTISPNAQYLGYYTSGLFFNGDSQNGSDGTGNPGLVVQLNNTTLKPPLTPTMLAAGWSSAAGVYSPPSTAPVTMVYTFSDSGNGCSGNTNAIGTGSTQLQALNAATAITASFCGGTQQTRRYEDSGGTQACLWVGSTKYTCVAYTSVSGTKTAPAGYNQSTGALVDASQVMYPKDGRCTILRSGNVFSGDPKDPDCLASAMTSSSLGFTGQNVPTVSSDGKSIVWPDTSRPTSLTTSSDGKLVLTTSSSTSDGKTVTTTITFDPSQTNASGDVKVVGSATNVSDGVTAGYVGSGSGSVSVDMTQTNTKLDAVKTSVDDVKTKLDEAMPSVTNPALPSSTSFYTREYSGFVQVWNEKKAALDQTPLFLALSKLSPPALPAGQCPSFVIPGNVGIFNAGDMDVSPPCWIWDVLKALFMLSAFFAARRIVFGG